MGPGGRKQLFRALSQKDNRTRSFHQPAKESQRGIETSTHSSLPTEASAHRDPIRDALWKDSAVFQGVSPVASPRIRSPIRPVSAPGYLLSSSD